MRNRLLLDSNTCIACLRRKPWALQTLASQCIEDIAVSSITVGELAMGVRLSEHPSREAAKVEAFLAPINIIAFDEPIAREWAAIAIELRKQGTPIETEDAMIAATARLHELTLVTGNTRHFARIPNLKLANWEKAEEA